MNFSRNSIKQSKFRPHRDKLNSENSTREILISYAIKIRDPFPGQSKVSGNRDYILRNFGKK
jgi:hypothetical protein